jgi:hypothetical protein
VGRPLKEDDIAELLRLLNEDREAAGKLDPQKAELPAVSRRQLVRKLQGLRKGSAAPPVKVELLPPDSPARKATEAAYQKTMQFLATVQHNAGRDLSSLAKVPPQRRYAHLPKPWKGRAGRVAIATNWNAKQHGEREARRAWVLDLSRQGHTPAEIRSLTGIGERTVRAYLNGR